MTTKRIPSDDHRFLNHVIEKSVDEERCVLSLGFQCLRSENKIFSGMFDYLLDVSGLS